MNSKFQEFFSHLVCVQLREAVPICAARHGSSPQKAMEFRCTTDGAVPIREVVTQPVMVQRDAGEDSPMVYTTIFESCMLNQGVSGERISIMYPVEDLMFEISIDPELIVSVTRIIGARPGSAADPGTRRIIS